MYVLMFMLVYAILFLNLFVTAWLMRLLFKKRMLASPLEDAFAKARKFMRWNGIFALFFCGEAGLLRIIRVGGTLQTMYAGYSFMAFIWFVELAMALFGLAMLYIYARKSAVSISHMRQFRKIAGMAIIFLIISSLLASVTHI